MNSIKNIFNFGLYAGLTVLVFALSFFLGNSKPENKLHAGLSSFIGLQSAEAETTNNSNNCGGRVSCGNSGGGSCGCSSSGASSGTGGSCGSACGGGA